MITYALITGTVAAPTEVFYASVTGEKPPTAARQDSAVTTIILCNVTGNSETVSMYFVKDSELPDTDDFSNMVVNALEIPAGETVFFSDERIVLDGGDGILIGASTPNAISATVSSMAI